VKVLTATN